MSRLTDTKRAYDLLVKLLDQELRQRRGSTKELEQFRKSLDVAFYLLGWGQFEYLVRQEARDLVQERSQAKTVEGYAWRHLAENMKGLPMRVRLDLIFHSNRETRDQLHKDYESRNDAAHNYKLLPSEAKRDVSAWLQHLEDLVDKFDA